MYEEILSDQQFADLYEHRNSFGLLINQYILAKRDDGKVVGKFRWDGEQFCPLSKVNVRGFFPRSAKQECLCDLLMNKDIPIKIIAGCAGSGKTKLCIVFGLDMISRGKYEKMFVVRHNVSVGEKNGYLKGNKNEKIEGWLGFLKDNMDSIQFTIEDLITMEKLEVDGVEYLKGRDIKTSWMLIDEAEDLTTEQFKMIGERVSEGSIICFVGDVNQVTNDVYRTNSGLRRAIEKLKGHPLVGIVVFDDNEKDNVRSETSKVFTSLY